MEDVFVGRGCFAVVKVQLFQGIKVAVKELLPRTVLADVLQEASIFSKLSHPCVPYLFGIYIRQQPYKTVMLSRRNSLLQKVHGLFFVLNYWRLYAIYMTKFV